MRKPSFLPSVPQALDLDYQGRRRLSRPAVLLLVLALAACAWQVWRYQDLAGQSVALEERLALAQKRAARAVPAAASGGSIELAQKLALPWDGLLSSVQGALGPDVALLSLAADGATVKLSGEAPSLEETLAFVQRLDKSGVLVRPELLSHEVKPVAGRNVVAFSVRSAWRGR